MRHVKTILLLVTICSLTVVLSMCMQREDSHDPRGKMFAGSLTCQKCHQAIYDGYLFTAHYNTTRPASAASIHGSFNKGENAFDYGENTRLVMEKRDSGFFQVMYVNGEEKEAHRFDITFGTRHAQTYLYWNANRFYELPLSYYDSVKSWAASPGFSSTHVNSGRFVGKECFECHSSNISTSLVPGMRGVQEIADRATMVYGIDCERCHGPAINHVNFHNAYPKVTEAKYIVKSVALSRQQKLDACAICHSGNEKTKEVSAFRFRPGDTLANYFSPWAFRDSKKSDFDVHGNQYQLLAQSMCFLKSKTITCSTCHNPHTNASEDPMMYSNKCMSCHANPDHSKLKPAPSLVGNCIDCHMPRQPSQAITFQLSGEEKKSAYLLRTHRIAIYKNEISKN